MGLSTSRASSSSGRNSPCCMAVETGFDTDCNGATVGSILGMFRGTGIIESKWSDPVNGALDTTIEGHTRYRIDDLVKTTMKHIGS